MKKISIIAAAALALATAAPVLADTKVQSDPFVSTQGGGLGLGLGAGAGVVAAVIVVTIAVAASDGS